ncbi:zinc finger DHHC domain containing protein [Tubulinosema ratisbonensis]|uniref:Palmitoyltransferase n=1 Tax=Tubulinosema ratisbonensis TaxID=291195 RepID=A0A437AJV8_9MICR|nr:zinc finger DHHC domain containing protein [Tubulinosema ratisbonensis]
MLNLFFLIRLVNYCLFTISIFFYILAITTCISNLSILSTITLYFLTLSLFYYLSIILRKNVIEDGNELCDRCKIFHNSKANYCLFCDRCYLKKDHHSPWLGKCIHNQNYKEFFGLIFFLDLSLFLLGFLQNFIFLFVLSLVVLIYLSFICYVWAHNMTTREYILGEKGSPSAVTLYNVLFDGSLQNVFILFLPFRRVYVNFSVEH